MIERYLPNLPYELIGQGVVALVLGVIFLLGLALTLFGVLFVWVRGLTAVSNLMYRGYDTEPIEARPPAWKLRISGVTLALARFKFWKIPEAYRGADDLTENETTFRESLTRVFGTE